MATKPTVLDLCCGGGGSSWGLSEAGFDVIGVESCAAIAAIHQANHGNTICSDFRHLDPKDFLNVDGIWLSAPCQSHSRRRSKSAPERDDAELTLDFIPWLDTIKPRFLVVENVVGYERSESIQQLAIAVHKLGYRWQVYCPEVTFRKGWLNPKHWNNEFHWAGRPLNAKDFGVAQDRERVFLIATRDRQIPKIYGTTTKIVGWRKALGDLVHELPTSVLTEAQCQAVEKLDVADDLIIERVAYRDTPKIRRSYEPIWTLRAHLADDGKGGSRTKLIDVLVDGCSRSLTIEALAILSGFNPTYKFSGKMAVDMRVVGNAVAPPVARAIAELLV
jgi:DNA (cytosine-5)-methyltransferase 1